MAPQRKEDHAIPQGCRKAAITREVEQRGGGKVVPVKEQMCQLELHFGTAEDPANAGADGKAVSHLGRTAKRAVPKPKCRDRKGTSATMEDVTSELRAAFQKIASNKGAPGPDRQSITEVRKHLEDILPQLRQSLLEETYEPGNIRRVWIPKKGGGQRGLGIPNVIDRTVAEAIRRVLEPHYEPKFREESHGFRPGRSCHTAIAAAIKHVEEGYEWVVDLDLEKFFDRVPHQRLMARLSERVKDRRLLVLIGKMLKAKVVMPDGVVVSNDEGVPQGGPLSPLLSNIVLNELDEELARRGHRFVRYADDCNVYVRSERAGQRVMASITRYIEGRLRLKVNREKSAVARTEERHFLGFTLWRNPWDGAIEVQLSERTKERINDKIRELTPRNWGNSLSACIRQTNVYFTGWINFFGICTGLETEKMLMRLDAHTRRRMRAIQLKHWKRKRTRARKLIHLGVHYKTAWRCVYNGRKSIWALSHSSAVDRGLRNAYFAERGLVSLWEMWRGAPREIVALGQQQPRQLLLGLGYREVVTRPASGVIT